MAETEPSLLEFTLPNDTGVCLLECTTAFSGLTDKEKLYSHYISQAAFTGGLIVLIQTSPESPGVYLLLQKVFRSQPISELEKIALDNGVSAEEFQSLLTYAAGFYANMGNYKSFGDSKFIPKLSQEKFELVVMQSAASKSDPKGIRSLWDRVSERLYSLDSRHKELGLGENV